MNGYNLIFFLVILYLFLVVFVYSGFSLLVVSEHWLVVVWSILGKFGSSGGFVLIYQQGCEVFPTVLRSTGLGFMSLIGSAVNAGVPQLVFWVSVIPSTLVQIVHFSSKFHIFSYIISG